MSREEPKPATGWAHQLHHVWERFRDGRLYVQVVLSLVLTAITALVAVGPGKPLARARTALMWVASHDYDFAGQAGRLNAWARGRGGWGPAVAGVWQSAQGRVQAWVARVSPAPGPSPPPVPAPSPPPSPPPSPSPSPAAPAVASPTFGSPAWGLPVANATVLHGYGWLPGAVSDRLHEGIDFAAPVATPVVAVSDGAITRITADPQLGPLIEATHGDFSVLYAQVTAIRVQKGDRVKRGQVLAAVGTPVGAEKQMQPHLHFAVRPTGKQASVDPAFHLGLGGSQH